MLRDLDRADRHDRDRAAVTGTELMSRRLGGTSVAASDEWFGPKEALLDPQPPAFDPQHTQPAARWSTGGRPAATPTGDDWVIVRLGDDRAAFVTVAIAGHHERAPRLPGYGSSATRSRRGR